MLFHASWRARSKNTIPRYSSVVATNDVDYLDDDCLYIGDLLDERRTNSGRFYTTFSAYPLSVKVYE